MKKLIFVLLLAAIACTYYKIVEVDPETGYFPSKAKADVIKHEKCDLDSMKSLILVSAGNFLEGQVRNMKYFDKIIDQDELQTIIVQEGLQDKVPSIRDKIGINKAYVNYKPFLWLRYKTRQDERGEYAQFILTDPKDMEDIFIAEKYLDRMTQGEAAVSDQATWYPLCNALIDYIKENSRTYRQP